MLISVFDKDVDGSPETLGGKGYGLWWMQQQDINVPPAMIIPTSVCVEYMASPKATMSKIAKRIKDIQMFFVKEFDYLPLLSVRSGARVSMPGMMDTILNVGLDSQSLNSWEVRIGEDCAIDSFKRLITMYGNVVQGVERKELEKETLPEALNAYERKVGSPFPKADDQLLSSIEAVFKSWGNERAKVYRKMNNIPEDWGTAVVIQAMVFGNKNEDSGTGVLFTRDPDTGENKVTGEFLVNAQGEDVVAGTRTPMKLSMMSDWNPEVANELLEVVSKLEAAKTDVQDVEFTVQDKKLYVLQTRDAKRSATAAVKIALDMIGEGLITEETAISRVSPRDLDLADQPVIDPKFTEEPDATGLPACSGIQTGVVCLSSKDAVNMAAAGKKAILVSDETTPDDIAGMAAAVGVLTMTGGSTSHAAVVARSMNRTCVVGLGTDHHHKFTAGMTVSIDGGTGRVWLKEVPVVGGSNPNVGKFRSMLLKDTKLIVEEPPKFHVQHLVLNLQNKLHLFVDEVLKEVKKCEGLCNRLDFFVDLGGVSSTFYTPGDLLAKAEVLMHAIDKQMAGKEYTLYGVPVNGVEKTVPVEHSLPDLENLVLLKSGKLLQSIAEPTAAQQKVIDWLAADGIEIGLWNMQDSKHPKSYSVAMS